MFCWQTGAKIDSIISYVSMVEDAQLLVGKQNMRVERYHFLLLAILSAVMSGIERRYIVHQKGQKRATLLFPVRSKGLQVV